MVTQLQKEIPIAFYPQEPNQGGSLQDTTLINASTPKYMHIIIHSYIATYSYIHTHTYIHAWVCTYLLYTCLCTHS